MASGVKAVFQLDHIRILLGVDVIVWKVNCQILNLQPNSKKTLLINVYIQCRVLTSFFSERRRLETRRQLDEFNSNVRQFETGLQETQHMFRMC